MIVGLIQYCYDGIFCHTFFLLFTLILGGVHGTFATGATSQQRTLTPPDTWSCPIGDLLSF